MNSLKFGPMAIAATLLFSTAAFADECDSKTAEAAAKIGGTVLPRMVIGIQIEHPAVKILAVTCEDHKATLIVAQSREPAPPAGYYEIVGRFIATAFPFLTAEEASSELLKCQAMTGQKSGEWKANEVKGIRFQCRSDGDGYGPVMGAHPL